MRDKSADEDAELAPSPYDGAVSPYGDHGQHSGIDESGFSLFDLIGVLRRRWEIALTVTVIGTCAAAAYGVTRPDIHAATASLLIEPDNKQPSCLASIVQRTEQAISHDRSRLSTAKHGRIQPSEQPLTH